MLNPKGLEVVGSPNTFGRRWVVWSLHCETCGMDHCRMHSLDSSIVESVREQIHDHLARRVAECTGRAEP